MILLFVAAEGAVMTSDTSLRFDRSRGASLGSLPLKEYSPVLGSQVTRAIEFMSTSRSFSGVNGGFSLIFTSEFLTIMSLMAL